MRGQTEKTRTNQNEHSPKNAHESKRAPHKKKRARTKHTRDKHADKPKKHTNQNEHNTTNAHEPNTNAKLARQAFQKIGTNWTVL